MPYGPVAPTPLPGVRNALTRYPLPGRAVDKIGHLARKIASRIAGRGRSATAPAAVPFRQLPSA